MRDNSDSDSDSSVVNYSRMIMDDSYSASYSGSLSNESSDSEECG